MAHSKMEMCNVNLLQRAESWMIVRKYPVYLHIAAFLQVNILTWNHKFYAPSPHTLYSHAMNSTGVFYQRIPLGLKYKIFSNNWRVYLILWNDVNKYSYVLYLALFTNSSRTIRFCNILDICPFTFSNGYYKNREDHRSGAVK